MFGGLYRWTMGLAGHRRAVPSLLALCVAEASLFPVPADVLLIPIVLAQRERAWRIALLCTLASVAGGLIGYGIGYFLFETVGRPLLEFYGFAERFADYQARYNDVGLLDRRGGRADAHPLQGRDHRLRRRRPAAPELRPGLARCRGRCAIRS